MKTIFNLLIVALLSSYSIAQQTKKEKYALELFSNMEYVDASNVFSELYSKGIKKNEFQRYVCEKAALSFYYSRNYKESQKYFLVLAEKNMISDEMSYLFYDCLVRNSNYNDVVKFQKMIPKELINDNLFEYLNDVSKDSLRYNVSESSVNSGKGEYGAIVIDSLLYFSSNKGEIGYTHESYGWDGINYSNLYRFDSVNGIQLVNDLNMEYHDGPISKNNGKYYVTRTKYVKKGRELVKHVGVYIIENGLESAFNYNSNSYNVGHVCFDANNNMYFASDKPGGFGESDIYMCKYVDGRWDQPINMGERVNTKENEMFPYVDSLSNVYFSSNGKIGFGGLDIYYLSAETQEVINLGKPINSSGDDFSFFINKSGDSGYLSSDRNGNVDRIYNLKINPFKAVLNVVAMDFIKKSRLLDLETFIVDRETSDTMKLDYVDSVFTINLFANKDYILLGKKKDYELHAPIYLNTERISYNDTITKTIYFDQTQYDLMVKTVVKGTNEILPGVDVEFTDPKTKEIIRCVTDENGMAYVNINNNYDYSAFAQKIGFLDLNQDVHTDAMTLIELDLKMEEIKKDVVFVIDNILYDLDKFYLRDQSKFELDKLADFLITNGNITVELSSHTDSRSSSSYNKTLSQKRAQSCVDYLIQKGIGKNRIIAKGYGESMLINECSDGVECSEEQHQLNRRTEIKILSVN